MRIGRDTKGFSERAANEPCSKLRLPFLSLPNIRLLRRRTRAINERPALPAVRINNVSIQSILPRPTLMSGGDKFLIGSHGAEQTEKGHSKKKSTARTDRVLTNEFRRVFSLHFAASYSAGGERRVRKGKRIDRCWAVGNILLRK